MFRIIIKRLENAYFCPILVGMADFNNFFIFSFCGMNLHNIMKIM